MVYFADATTTAITLCSHGGYKCISLTVSHARLAIVLSVKPINSGFAGKLMAPAHLLCITVGEDSQPHTVSMRVSSCLCVLACRMFISMDKPDLHLINLQTWSCKLLLRYRTHRLVLFQATTDAVQCLTCSQGHNMHHTKCRHLQLSIRCRVAEKRQWNAWVACVACHQCSVGLAGGGQHCCIWFPWRFECGTGSCLPHYTR